MKVDTLHCQTNLASINIGIGHYATTKTSHISNCLIGRMNLLPNEPVHYYLESLLVEKEKKKIIMIFIDVIYINDPQPERHQMPIEKIEFSDAQILEIKEYHLGVYKYLKQIRLSTQTAVVKELN